MLSKFYFGIEHEIPLLDLKNRFLDFTNLNINSLTKVVEKFPIYMEDYSFLKISRLGYKTKRLYIEGLEIFDQGGYLKKYHPKGFELRMPPCNDIDFLFKNLLNDFFYVRQELLKFKMRPTFISFNPFRKKVNIRISMNRYEKRFREIYRDRHTHKFTLLSFGPDLNIANDGFDDLDVINIVQKLNFYTPFIVPFSYSSPFYGGKLWHGLSVRTFLRSRLRPAVVGVVVSDKIFNKFADNLIVKKLILPKQKGLIEYKAFDVVQDIKIYKGLFALLLGIIMDTSLKGKSLWPDLKLIKLSSIYGFNDTFIYDGAFEVLVAAQKSLKSSKYKNYLKVLYNLLKERLNLAVILRNDFLKTKSINKTLAKFSQFIF